MIIRWTYKVQRKLNWRYKHPSSAPSTKVDIILTANLRSIFDPFAYTLLYKLKNKYLALNIEALEELII